MTFSTVQLTRDAGLPLALAITVSGAVALVIFIGSLTSSWVILIAWGLFPNSPFPLMDASIIDPVPEGGSSGLGIMICVGLGLSGLVAAPEADFVIGHFGFTVHHLFTAALFLLALVHTALIRETASGVPR